MTMRERNQIFHEVPLKHIFSKTTSVPVSAVFMDKPEEYTSEVDVCNIFSPLFKIYCLSLFIILKHKLMLQVNFVVKIVFNIYVMKHYMVYD